MVYCLAFLKGCFTNNSVKVILFINYYFSNSQTGTGEWSDLSLFSQLSQGGAGGPDGGEEVITFRTATYTFSRIAIASDQLKRRTSYSLYRCSTSIRTWTQN